MRIDTCVIVYLCVHGACVNVYLRMCAETV